MLKQRVFTALLLAPLALAGVFWLPVAGFAVFIGLVIMLGAWEWANLAGFEQQSVRVAYAVLAGVACWLTYFLTPALVLGVSGLWWLVAFWLVRGYPGNAHYCQSRVLRLVMGFLTLVPAWYALVQLKQHPQSGFMIALVLLMIWAADCGAYFAGKALGKNKLA
ncbi:MAG: phosphatidate cytidylyltransferase, partial [Endozoicomonas sp.]